MYVSHVELTSRCLVQLHKTVLVPVPMWPLFSPQCLSVCLTVCTCEYPFDTEVLPGSFFSSAWPVHPNCLDYTGTVVDRQISYINRSNTDKCFDKGLCI